MSAIKQNNLNDYASKIGADTFSQKLTNSLSDLVKFHIHFNEGRKRSLTEDQPQSSKQPRRNSSHFSAGPAANRTQEAFHSPEEESTSSRNLQEIRIPCLADFHRQFPGDNISEELDRNSIVPLQEGRNQGIEAGTGMTTFGFHAQHRSSTALAPSTNSSHEKAASDDHRNVGSVTPAIAPESCNGRIENTASEASGDDSTLHQPSAQHGKYSAHIHDGNERQDLSLDVGGFTDFMLPLLPVDFDNCGFGTNFMEPMDFNQSSHMGFGNGSPAIVNHDDTTIHLDPWP